MKKLLTGPASFVLAAITLSPVAANETPAAKQHEFSVYFDKDSAALVPSGQRLVKSMVDKTEGKSGVTYIVTGHTDTRLSKGESLLMSARNALRIYEHLRSLKVPESAIYTAAMGETQLAKTTKDGVSEPLNRRVSVTIFYKNDSK